MGLLEDLGLYGFHAKDVRKSYGAGWPDWCIIGRERLIFRELKSDEGRLSKQQLEVRDKLRRIGMDWGVWRPEHWHTRQIHDELTALL